jgi:hypothetical protein
MCMCARMCVCVCVCVCVSVRACVHTCVCIYQAVSEDFVSNSVTSTHRNGICVTLQPSVSRLSRPVVPKLFQLVAHLQV